MSLFSAVEYGPARPDPGSERAVCDRPEPEQGQSRRRRLLRRERQTAAAGLRGGGRAAIGRSRPAARLPAHRWHRRLRCSGAGARLRRRKRRDQVQARGHGADPRWHRRPQDRRRSAQAPEPTGQGADQRPELGEPPRPVHQRRLRGRELPVLRRCPPRCRRYRLCGPARRARSGCQRQHRRPARLLPQPDRLRPDAGAVGRGGHRSSRHAAWCRSSTWPTKGSARA